jgi:hypothetical protein
MFKRDINDGGAMFLNLMNRKFNKEFIKTNLVADQQYYQLPTEALRPSTVRVKNGDFWFAPEFVSSEEVWNKLNATTLKGSYPSYWYLRGFDEIGLFPIPSADATAALEVSFSPQHVELTEDDFTTGTVTVTNASATITHSATGFTEDMVGRYFQTADKRWYKIASYTSTSELKLENYYEGASGSSQTFKVGQVMKIPNAYLDAPVYYACDKYYLTQNDQQTANAYNVRFKLKVKSARSAYGRSTMQSATKKRQLSGMKLTWRDFIQPIKYP